MKYKCLVVSWMLIVSPSLFAQTKEVEPPLKIFILAGQYIMEGKGSVLVMNRQLGIPGKRERFSHLLSDGQWADRDDVWIEYLGDRGTRKGKLTVGYGISEPGSAELFGPELGFGWTVGDRLDEDVFIIKTAWGGKSLDQDFRPPSRGYPDSIGQMFDNAKRDNPNLTMDQFKESYGHYFRLMIDEIRGVTGDLKSYVPDYHDQGFEIAGFVWFQGWNDQYAPTSVEDYQENLVHFIQGVRSELASPRLPFVIGAMGHDGINQSGKIKQIADAQVATADTPEFQGTVRAIRTTAFWDLEAEHAYQQYWEDESTRDVEKWREFGNDRGYHYFGSPVFFYNVGGAFGDAMLELIHR